MKHIKQRTLIGLALAARLLICFTTALSLNLVPPSSLSASPNAAVSTEDVLSAVDKISPTIEEVGLKVWEFSEPPLLEMNSSGYFKDVLKKNGFKITSEGTAGVPAAFVSESGSGKPILGIMLEYDALPGLGNAAEAVKEAREDGVTVGDNIQDNS